MADVRICGSMCPEGYAAEEDSSLWTGTRCSEGLARVLGATVGGAEDACGIRIASQAVIDGVVTAQALYEGSKA